MPTRRTFLHGAAGLAALAACVARAPAAEPAAAPLIARPIGATGETLPVIGLGTARTFDVEPDPQSLAPLGQVVRTLLDGGGTVIDTAPSYGRAQAVTGALLAPGDLRRKVFLATKIWTSGRENGRAEFEQALAELRTDRVDLLQVHNLSDVDAILPLIREFKDQGRTRHIGITHYREASHDDVLAVLERERVDFVQINYSVEARNADRRLLPYCADRGIAVLVNRPFSAGNLFAKVRGQSLPPWAAEIGCTSWAQLMLKYIVAHPAVTAVIPATSKPANMADSLQAGRGPLPDEAMRRRIVELFA